ncbi:MAG: serine acetyltransferase [Myxococcales bacterium]|nr:serine acetyltransferase [Myxococcales bacterium]
MGLFRRAFDDAFQLARALRRKEPDAEPTMKDALRAALSQDGYKVLLMSRIREAARRRHIPGVNHALRLATTVLYGIEIGNDIELGEGIDFTHTLGTVIGGTSKVGSRVKFLGNNTIGTAKDNGCPIIEDDVVIGCGARVLGPIRIGARSFIGANAVVLDDVPPDSVVSGIPARAHKRRDRDGEAEQDRKG